MIKQQKAHYILIFLAGVTFCYLAARGLALVNRYANHPILCWTTAAKQDHDPAWEMEASGLRYMVHETVESLKCSGDFDGKYVSFMAMQVLVKRKGVLPVQHQPQLNHRKHK